MFVEAFCYAVLISLALFGAGSLVVRLFPQKRASVPEQVLLGLIPTMIYGAILNFVEPIGIVSRLGYFVAAAGLALVSAWKRPPSIAEIGWSLASLLYFVVDGTGGSLAYDTGLYHIQSVKWAEQYAAIPGLAALHTRIGFNPLSLIASAVMHVSGDWVAPMLLNSVVVAATHAMMTSHLCRLPQGQLSAAKASISTSLALCIWVALLWGRQIVDTGSLGTDTIPVMLILVTLLWCVRKFETGEAAPFAGVIAALAIVAKISSAAIAIPCALLALWGAPKSLIRRTMMIGGTLLAVWVARSVLLSGYLVYPVCSTRLPLPWSVSWWVCDSDQFWIVSWARIPTHNTELTRGMKWVATWAQATAATPVIRIAAILAFAGAVLQLWRPRRERWYWGLIGLASMALVAWFLSAPSVRYGAALPICLSALLFAGGLPVRPIPRWAGLVLASAVLCLSCVRLYGRGTSWPFIPRVETNLRNINGLEVHVPVRGDQCWDAELPCTPYPDLDMHFATAGIQSANRNKAVRHD